MKYNMGNMLHHFIQKFEYLASNYGIITAIKIKLCKKAVEKRSGRC